MKTVKAAEFYADSAWVPSKAVKILVKTAFEAGAEFAQRWIPVEEELPETGEYVAIRCVSPTEQVFYMYQCRTGKQNSDGSEHWSFIPERVKVTHWKRLDFDGKDFGSPSELSALI